MVVSHSCTSVSCGLCMEGNDYVLSGDDIIITSKHPGSQVMSSTTHATTVC